MVDLNRPWVGDTELSTRFPVYTRGNTGEVAGRVATPLSWSAIGGKPAEVQWRKALAEFGAFDEEEFRPGQIDTMGLIHGYIYMNLSIQRVFGARMPGATPELMDRAYLGDSAGAPPYEPQPGDDAPHYAERITATINRVLSTKSRPDLEEDARRAAKLRAARPDLSAMSDRDLLARHHQIMADCYADVLRKHLLMVYESSVVTGLLQEVVAELGDPTLEVRLMGGWGEVASAAPSMGLWKLSRAVRASQVLTGEFEAGVDGLNERLRARTDEDSAAFVKAFEEFLFEFGSRSTDEWEALPPTWETHPHIALGLVDRMRLQPDDRSPEHTAPRVRQEREAATAELRKRLSDKPELLGKLETALQALSVWMPARELSKTTTIRILHEARMPFWELGRRYVEKGRLEQIEDLGMLKLDELEQLIDDPASVTGLIAERKEWKARLEELEPPFVAVAGQVPPPSQWKRRSDPAADPARPGDILTGLGACPGSATGVARIIHNPAEAGELQPGEILVAPVTDPGWTPLFTSAEAVVVNVGSPLSHAAIVSRELGIPAVLAVEQATKRIKDGTLITVDGTAGTVTVH